MLPQTFPQLAQLIQLAIGPVVLISGVGLILLTMTNRFGRIIDRGRRVADLIEAAHDPHRRDVLRLQLHILRRQARLMRMAVSLVVLAIFLVVAQILVTFIGTEVGGIPVTLATLLFFGALLSVLVAMGFFLREILLSTTAHDLDLKRHTEEHPVPAKSQRR
ncbi:MAG: DUF2721 domain-containing protein [Gemmatimonadaceae bacterium]|nr:DUF2721 domain-containing protein [Gemmatimonadaceae bacterium]